MGNTKGTPVESTKKSLVTQPQNSPQLSGRDAVALSLTQTGKSLSEISDSLPILILLLENITRHTISGDVVALSCYATQDQCRALGISEDSFAEVMKIYLKFSECRKRNPLAF